MSKPAHKPPSSPPAAPLSTAQRRYLYLTAAVTGAAIMIIEILGAKMLAPYVGTSHFVWTAQIAVTLLALSTGYYAGGRWADGSPRPASLYLAILAAGVYLCVAVTQVEQVAYACLNLKLALGSLLASGILFFVPLALLATTGPFLVRMLTPNVQNIGGSMGRLTAVSTLGSVAGTILIGYLLVPLLLNSMTMLLTAGTLIGMSGSYFVIWRAGNSSKAGALLALATLAGSGLHVHSTGTLATPSFREIYRGNSNFGQLQVFESRHKPYRYFINDNLTQGAYDTQLRKGLGSWADMLHAFACAYTTNVSDVLVVGLGVGLVPMQFAREGARVDVVEINPAVVALAQKFFDLEPDRLNIQLGDGRQFINASRKLYDAVVLDAFLGDAAPSHLMTSESFTAMRRILRPNGVLVINCHGDTASGRDFLVASLKKTLDQVFSGIEIRASQDPGHISNVFCVVSPMPLSLYRPPTFAEVHPDNRDYARTTFSRRVEPDIRRGVVLTDNFNPVDYFEAENRERSRRAMVASMQSVAKEGAIP